MGMTMTEKILARHAGLERVVPGQLIKAKLDLILVNDITGAPAIKEFEKISGSFAKRSGPLVAIVITPPDPDYAERLLSDVRFKAQVTQDEYVPTQRDNIGNLVVNAFVLIGILLVFALVSGLALGGYRALRKRARHGEEADSMITLHL